MLPIVAADAGGVAQVWIPIPANPALRGHAGFVHAFVANGASFEAAPPIGGVLW